MAHVTILQRDFRGLLETVKMYKAHNEYDAAFTNQKCSLSNTGSFEIMGSQGFN
jgi:hypothetical protein